MIEGGVIKVPAEGTLLAGFDFDIDKLFLMRKEFNLKLDRDMRLKLWNKFYTLNPKIKEELLSKYLNSGEATEEETERIA